MDSIEINKKFTLVATVTLICLVTADTILLGHWVCSHIDKRLVEVEK